jgi:glycyl-tRNA synthetase
MTQPLNFQSIILSLQHFWAEQGCLIWQPYYTQVGAGTMNPATFLRVLGPEPWKVAYVEPSIRPDDARYGENPNRMQQHYQFQVILKPDPGNPQEIYLRSLEAIGIDPRQHDIRFVEDNWEQPAIGAWGLGWEVWLDGQEITQFTYFQQAGGQLCDPVSVEMTYGLDRIAIALQRVSGFTEIRWNDVLTDGDVNLQGEIEHSRYYFEVADVGRLRQMYDLFEAEATACLSRGLVLPAHDYILKCSHTFNVLDTRGAIGVTERQAFFGRMRDLARRTAETYLEQRQRLEYPFLKDQGFQDEAGIDGRKKPGIETQGPEITASSSTPSPLLIEIGTEELPAGDLDNALEQLRQRVPLLLDELRLAHGVVNVSGTPRRLVVLVEAVAPGQPDLEQVVKGPPAARAFDALGLPTKAAEGFARSKGVEISALEPRDMDGGRYVVAVVRQAGRPAAVVLSEALPGLIASIRFDKTMRWNHTNVFFSRPIRWLLALFGEQVIPFEYAGLRSGRITRGLRFLEPAEKAVASPAEYFAFLKSQGILLDVAERREVVRSLVAECAAGVQGVSVQKTEVEDDPALISEVANLVEVPNPFIGSFDASHLSLPREVLISVMKKHQRYFPVEKAVQNLPAGGELLPYFIAVRNGGLSAQETETGMDLVVEGNQHVIRARFADAAFFVRADLKHTLADFLPRLGTLAFQVKLGSMLDKTHRITSLVESLATSLGLPPQEAAVAQRAAELCKADLATHMVIEMTSLQGVMGRYYALRSGETEAVAAAIYEHYLPRYTGDKLPQSLAGVLVGVADRLDTLAGLFAAGMAPSGAKDPFALRRAALGLMLELIGARLDLDLRSALDTAASRLPIPASPESTAACLTFIVERLRNLLLDQGSRFDVVDAVLAAQGYNPASAQRAVQELSAWVARPDWNLILPAYARCVRITRDLPAQKTGAERFTIDPQAFVEPEEQALYAALQTAEAAPRLPGSPDDFLKAFLPMMPGINTFFDKVLVMVEDNMLRQNRLGLLQRIAGLAAGAADMSKLEGF